jgi:gliding motility-associated-like protein
MSPIIDVYNQCPLIVPNVITSNGDGVNDFLIITNLEDYDKVSLTIMNRWGTLVYENDNYQNDWKGLDQNGNALSEGVYFYLVTPTSIKYTYDDVTKSQYTLHGIVHLFSND